MTPQAKLSTIRLTQRESERLLRLFRQGALAHWPHLDTRLIELGLAVKGSAPKAIVLQRTKKSSKHWALIKRLAKRTQLSAEDLKQLENAANGMRWCHRELTDPYTALTDTGKTLASGGASVAVRISA